ncbi:CaiB/BaiF CoA transferase family protein [Kordiimonas marina]|uniref:CaiB/BaiF CoA transferase family protein n=1 Tax=Kordiimonas marina TaxID=2872312 RepID=UPI001FF4AF7B|nr:CaiB/BaiF CoA-transferase family protein [Kordiimonas marina]MCJ9427829.1 CoA transferase [Kordiimonas marina]
MAGPLSGIRVLDLSRILAGPWATQCLADLGADVIKIERPGAGDDTRTWGPPFFEEGETRLSAYYMCANRGKRSVTVDMTKPEGQALIRRLVEQSDILVENFKVGGLKKYGLDYDSLKAVNPGLIYCSITGFGQTGPYKDRPGYDALIQALGGLMSITGEPDGVPGGGPMKVGVAVTDLFTGLYSTIGILGALHHREKTGVGQHIDMALMDTQIAVLANQSMNYLVSGKEPKRLGTAHPSIVPYQAFRTSDGHMVLAVGNDGQFARFCKAAGMPALAEDPRFATNPARVANREELIPIVAGMIAGRTTDEWTTLLEEANVPGGPINTMGRVFDDAQVQARGTVLTLEAEDGTPMPSVANPIRFSETPVVYDKAPPALGADTDTVLTDVLGLSAEEQAIIRASKVLG